MVEQSITAVEKAVCMSEDHAETCMAFLEFEVDRLKKLLSDGPEAWDIEPIQESIRYQEAVILGIKRQLYPGFEARVQQAVAMRRGEPT